MPGNLHMIRIFRKSARLRQINATGNVRFKAQMWRPVRGKADFRSGPLSRTRWSATERSIATSPVPSAVRVAPREPIDIDPGARQIRRKVDTARRLHPPGDW
jgi:hypothetical protein